MKPSVMSRLDTRVRAMAKFAGDHRVHKRRKLAATVRQRHAGLCNYDLLLLRGALSNLRRLAIKYALPDGFRSALGRTETVIQRRIVELRTRGPVEVSTQSPVHFL